MTCPHCAGFGYVEVDAIRTVGRLRELIDSIRPHAMDRDDFAEFLNDIENILNDDA